MTQDPLRLAKSIDHTLLRPEAVEAQYGKLCSEAKQHSFMSVCVPPTWLNYCASELEGSDVRLCTVIGFPLGYHEVTTKTHEAKLAIAAGADELDMVLNISALKSSNLDQVRSELEAFRETCENKVIKLILETCYLNESEKTQACELALEFNWDFVKTSTGFGDGGASIGDVKLMKSVVGDGSQVKASGGIHDQATALKMLEAGASRLGTSAGVTIVTGGKASKGSY